MALKIAVEDRIPTYPGRVVLTPVSGVANTYDLTRADNPISDGTPINKALLDNKAYTLTENATVYVATNGSDIDGDGTIDNPYLTIQTAIDSVPKHLGGYTATISVGFGVYKERLSVVGFSGGKLVIGQPGEVFSINGIDIVESSLVETNIYQIEYNQTGSKGLFDVSNGSNVLISSDMILDGVSQAAAGIRVVNDSKVSVETNRVITVNNCAGAITAQKCSLVSVDTITGSENTVGMTAYLGSIISYKSNTMDTSWGNDASSGGLILTGNNSTSLSGATLEL